MTDWSKIRKQFPVTGRFTYLNAAGGSPVSQEAARAGKEFYDEILARGDAPWPEWLKRAEEVRGKVAEFINAEKSEIAFTLNTSLGMNLIAGALKGKGGVLTMRDEFPSSTFPWMQQKYRVRFVEPIGAVYPLEEIEAKITKRTKVLVTSHVQYRTGFKQDLVGLGRLCRRRGLIFVVNASQSAGAMPIDVKKTKIDFLVFKSLKWLMGGYGAGVVYINKRWFGRIDYPVAGWRSVKKPGLMDNQELDLKREASELEVGCLHFPNIFALGGALDFLNKIGREEVRDRIYELNDYLVERLKKTGLEIATPLARKYRSGITIIKLENAQEIAEKLYRKKILVSARGVGLRISLHIYNNRRDIDKFITELLKEVDNGKK